MLRFGVLVSQAQIQFKDYSKNVTNTHHTLLTVPSFYFLDFGVFEKDSLKNRVSLLLYMRLLLLINCVEPKPKSCAHGRVGLGMAIG